MILPLRWQDRAACKGEDTAAFYLDAADYPDEIERLRNICRTCPVLADCGEYALKYESWGFWAGMTVSERRRIRSREGIAKVSIRNAHLALLPERQDEKTMGTP